MNANPYQPPPVDAERGEQIEVQLAVKSTPDPTHIFLLGIAFVTTLFFALLNGISEQLGNVSAVLFVTGIAVVSQIPGLIVSTFLIHRRSFLLRGLLVPAYFIAITGALAYIGYAANGKSDSIDSAAHMHVIMFPILHCIMAIVSFSGFYVFLQILLLFRSKN